MTKRWPATALAATVSILPNPGVCRRRRNVSASALPGRFRGWCWKCRSTTIDVALIRAAAFAGATIHVSDVAISAQVYAVPADATILRIGLGCRLQ